MDWRHGSSSRAPALKALRPTFKPQSHKKKKKRQDYVIQRKSSTERQIIKAQTLDYKDLRRMT
jgi:hypothetical protein